MSILSDTDTATHTVRLATSPHNRDWFKPVCTCGEVLAVRTEKEHALRDGIKHVETEVDAERSAAEDRAVWASLDA